MISGIDRGLIVNRFSGGQPSSNGDFSGVAKNSFLIEKGKVSSAVSETMISGNIIDMLNNIVAISKEQTTDGLSFMPWAEFDGVTQIRKNFLRLLCILSRRIHIMILAAGADIISGAFK